MCAGKAMAQASHASNAFIKHAKEVDAYVDNVDIWEAETKQGFGTVLVLETWDWAKTVLDVTRLKDFMYVCGVVHDPTYPIVDGSIVHHIPLDTCAYVYTTCKETDSFLSNALKDYKLYE